MITEQEQKILDEAPEGATHYFVGNGHVYYGGLSDLLLDDLRRKKGGFTNQARKGENMPGLIIQGKDVWDAVNWSRAGESMSHSDGRQ